jgi:hypothetical protein
MVLALLAGCAVGPDFDGPKLSSPGQWNIAATVGVTNGPAIDTMSFENFNDTETDSLAMAAR